MFLHFLPVFHGFLSFSLVFSYLFPSIFRGYRGNRFHRHQIVVAHAPLKESNWPPFSPPDIEISQYSLRSRKQLCLAYRLAFAKKIRGDQQNPQPAPTKRHPGLLAKQKVSECFQTLPRPRPTRNWQKQVTSKAESHKNYSNVRPFSLACHCRLPMFSAFRPLQHFGYFGHRGWSCMAGSSRNKSHSKA